MSAKNSEDNANVIRTKDGPVKRLTSDSMWRPQPPSEYEFGVAGIVRGKAGGAKFTDEKAIKDQYRVLQDLIKSMGQNIMQRKSIINISLPVRIFEPRSFLQRMTDVWCYAPLYLTNAAMAKDAVERLKWVVTFVVAGMHRGTTNKKPFNPILGETFEGMFADGTTICIEQVSHHPPISAYQVHHAEGLWRFHGHHEYKAAFRPNGIVGEQVGPNHVDFEDGGRVSFTYPVAKLSGMLMGDRLFNFDGKLEFEDVKNGVRCEIALNPDQLSWARSWISSAKTPSDHFRGRLLRDETELCEISGSWLENISFGGKVYWTQNEYEALMPLLPPDEDVLPSDCRFRSDLQALLAEDLDKAQVEKARLENLQRRDRQLRKDGGHESEDGSKDS